MHPLEISGPRLEVASRCVAFFPVPAFDRMVAATATSPATATRGLEATHDIGLMHIGRLSIKKGVVGGWIMGAVGLDKGRETRTNSRGRDLPFGTDMSQDDRCGTKGFGNVYDWVGFLARTELNLGADASIPLLTALPVARYEGRLAARCTPAASFSLPLLLRHSIW